MLEKYINPFDRGYRLYSSTTDLYVTSNTASVPMKPYSLISLQKYEPNRSLWYSNKHFKKETEGKMTQSSIYQRPYLENPFNKPSLTYNKQIQQSISSHYYSSIKSYESNLETYPQRFYQKRSYGSYQHEDKPYEKTKSKQSDHYFKPSGEIKSRKPVLKQPSFQLKKEIKDDYDKKNHYAESEKDEYEFNYEIEDPMINHPDEKSLHRQKQIHQEVQNQKYIFEENEQSFRKPDSPKFAENQVFPQYLEDRGRKFYFVALKPQQQ